MDDEQFEELVGLLREVIERLDTLNENIEMQDTMELPDENMPSGPERL